MNLLVDILIKRAGLDRETANKVVVALRQYAHLLPALLWEKARSVTRSENAPLPLDMRLKLN